MLNNHKPMNESKKKNVNEILKVKQNKKKQQKWVIVRVDRNKNDKYMTLQYKKKNNNNFLENNKNPNYVIKQPLILQIN